MGSPKIIFGKLRLCIRARFGDNFALKIISSSGLRGPDCNDDRDFSDGGRRSNWIRKPKQTTQNDLALGITIHYLAGLGDRFCCNPRLCNLLYRNDRIFVKRAWGT